MSLSEHKIRAIETFPTLDYLLNNPQFKESVKVMKCYNESIPARVNGEIVRITKFEYNMDPYSNTMKFGFDLGHWEGDYTDVVDIDISIFE